MVTTMKDVRVLVLLAASSLTCSSVNDKTPGAGGAAGAGSAVGGGSSMSSTSPASSGVAGGAAGGAGGATGGAGAQSGTCLSADDCDDGADCTTDSCEAEVCVHASPSTCGWPAESAAMATNLTEVGGPIECVLGFALAPNDLSENLSGAVWNPMSNTLWLVKNNEPSLYAVVQDGAGYRYANKAGVPASWEMPALGDVEGVTQVDFADTDIVYTLNEGQGTINRVDTTDYNNVVITHAWAQLPNLGGSGAEGLTFVPDAFLVAQGFVDQAGTPYASTLGMGGLMFVGHQSDGALHVYDLNPADDSDYVYVGKFMTGADETAGLEFDRSTGVLFMWHDASIDELELVSLSSTASGAVRVMDTIVTYSGPALTAEMSSNLEGIAITPVSDCVNGRRRLWITIDGGDCSSLMMFNQFPC